MSDPTASRPVPRLGNRFLIVSILGDGGTATVYLSFDMRTEAWVALKAIHKRYINDDEMRHRFGLEARALEMLRHPNIPRLIHYAPDSKPPFMAMELARCGSAMDWVRKNGPMPPAMACNVITQVCDAVTEAHRKGMIHRDIKPHNVLLDDTGVCKLTDFGIARLGDAPSLTATGSQIGTFSFMAPEQRSDTKAVDLRADIYSLGSSFYTMLTGRTSAELFVAESDDSLMHAVPELLRPIVLTATKYLPDERYPTAQALRDAVQRIQPDLDPAPPEAAPLVPRLEPLPARPPTRIPANRAFPELEGLVPGVGNDDTLPSSAPPQPGLSSLPYRMPDRGSPRRRPSDLVPPTGQTAVRNSTPKSLSREPAHVALPEEPQLAPPIEPSSSGARLAIQATALMLGLVGLVALFVVGVLGAGAYTVTVAHRHADRAARDLLTAVQTEATLLSRMRSDPTNIEDTLEHFRAAATDDEQLGAALEFVGAVEAADERGTVFEQDAKKQIQHLREAKEAYAEARQGWAASVREFPGRIAHGWGVVPGPAR